MPDQDLLARLDIVLAAEAAEHPAPADCRYDGHGDVTSIVDGDAVTAYRYDDRRRLVEVAHPDGRPTRYTYDEHDRLASVDDRGVAHRYTYDAEGRIARAQHGRSGAIAYAYDENGRLVEGRSATVTTRYHHDTTGLLVTQACDGVTIEARLTYADNRLQAVQTGTAHLAYEWNEGRLRTVTANGDTLVEARRRDGALELRLGNGLTETREFDGDDGRPLAVTIAGAEFRRTYRADGKLADDAGRTFDYDRLGRLTTAEDPDGTRWRYHYDDAGNRVHDEALFDDEHGRLLERGEFAYRYDDADQLTEVRKAGEIVARFRYDHSGRLAHAAFPDRTERYLYGKDGALLLVADGDGLPVRIPVHTPYGTLAELRPDGVRYLHADHIGTVLLTTDTKGGVIDRVAVGPYGETTGPATFGGKTHHPEIGIYDFGFRWYDPTIGRFLTRDTHTCGPDDARLVHPFGTGAQQVADRDAWLRHWLARPRRRNRHAFCEGDPVNRFDPDGHWAFGWLVLSILGAIWTLPNTVFALLIEVTNLIMAPVNWLVRALGGGGWQGIGFDAAAYGELNAFGLVFVGGWMGSALEGGGVSGITFGNGIFIREQRRGQKSLYHHELRHTNQYAWFGPLFGAVYLVDWIQHGYKNSRLETDARAHE
ncbi:RHS repeat domain-containing protein [Kutzneria sp. NPDC052558]|uniref:RHS repeat domain-containing protein n=1 Tax=Kutzneria sp. NPDC052558 TaxID=3364121 RepID=UPI0037CA7AB2